MMSNFLFHFDRLCLFFSKLFDDSTNKVRLEKKTKNGWCPFQIIFFFFSKIFKNETIAQLSGAKSTERRSKTTRKKFNFFKIIFFFWVSLPPVCDGWPSPSAGQALVDVSSSPALVHDGSFRAFFFKNSRSFFSSSVRPTPNVSLSCCHRSLLY